MTEIASASTVRGEQPDSSAYVGWNWNAYLPAFKDAGGAAIPFVPTGIRPPIGYQGDFYIDEFTDTQIKQAWQELKARDPATARQVLDCLQANYAIDPGKCRNTGVLDSGGAVDGNDDLKLADLRRPAFFGQAPYFEAIAAVESHTYTVEFTVPGDFFEQSQLKRTAPVKLRGWFIKGEGVPDAQGKRVPALVIFNNGFTMQTCAAQHPAVLRYEYNVRTKQYEGFTFPSQALRTEYWGARQNRQYLYGFIQAGFDLLVVDKRGHGISGGVNPYNSAEMAEDIFRMLDQMESGTGLTVLTPDGQLLQGDRAAGLLLGGRPTGQVPLLIAGESQGSIITCFAMRKNFAGWTAYNEPGQEFSPAKHYNIKAALLLADFAGGIGHVNGPDLRWGRYGEAVFRMERNTMLQPTAEILANINQWPAVFFGKGLWDNYQGAEGTFEAYRRVKGLKELVFVRGPHAAGQWGAANIAYMIDKMTEFAVRAVVNPGQKYPETRSFKEAVLGSPPYWEPSSGN
jgi:hypothetical protein